MTNFQASSSAQGAAFEHRCNTLLLKFGYVLHGKRKVQACGVEIDQVVETHSGQFIWYEFKGSEHGKRPGLLRTDSMKKAIANGALTRGVRGEIKFDVLTSHLPPMDGVGAGSLMMKSAMEQGYVDRFLDIRDIEMWADSQSDPQHGGRWED